MARSGSVELQKPGSARRGRRQPSPAGRVDDVLQILREQNPDPRCELFYRSRYQLLVSVVLSAQTTDKMVNRCMEPLYRKGFTPDTVLALGAEGLLERIRSIGLAPTKSRNVYNLTCILKEKHRGRVPGDRQALEALPGVGRKTSSVILGEVFGQPTLAVDTHVFRVTARLGFHSEKDAPKAEQKLLQVIDPRWLPAAHHWFILLGRYTCKARKPECDRCAVHPLCPSAAD